MLAQDMLCTPPHSVLIQGERIVPGIPRKKRWADRRAVDAVLVGLFSSGFSGMKLYRHLGGRQNPDGRGQNIVQGLCEILCRDGRLDRETCYLGQGMNSRISAA